MKCMMGFSFYIIPLLLVLLLYTVSCEHEYHHNHENDEKWQYILSKIEFLWTNKTDAPSTTTALTESHNKGNRWSLHDVEYTTELSTTPVIQNGTLKENINEAFKQSMALLVGVPIVSIIVLCCCCYCCCKCCAVCCCEDEEKGQVIVMQNNVQPSVPPPIQHTQVILQQPVYQTPVYGMQPAPAQWGPAPPQQPQWAAPRQQPHQYPPGAYDNPDYGEPSAPPPPPPPVRTKVLE